MRLRKFLETRKVYHLANKTSQEKAVAMNKRTGDVILTDHCGISVTVATKVFFAILSYILFVTFLGYFGQITLDITFISNVFE